MAGLPRRTFFFGCSSSSKLMSNLPRFCPTCAKEQRKIDIRSLQTKRCAFFNINFIMSTGNYAPSPVFFNKTRSEPLQGTIIHTMRWFQNQQFPVDILHASTLSLLVQIEFPCYLKSSINSYWSQWCDWFNQTFKKGDQFRIIWLLIKLHVGNSLKELFKWSRAEAAHQLRGGGHFLFAD